MPAWFVCWPSLMQSRSSKAGKLLPIAIRTLPFACYGGGPPPFPHELVYFRRTNRQHIASDLTNLFLRMLRRRFSFSQPVTEGDLYQFGSDAAIERLNIARHVDHCDD